MNNQNNNNKQRDLSGYIVKNGKKTTDKHPDSIGKLRVNGKELSLSLWHKEGADGLMTISAIWMEDLEKKLAKKDTPANNQDSSNNTNNGNNSGNSDSDNLFGDIFDPLP